MISRTRLGLFASLVVTCGSLLLAGTALAESSWWYLKSGSNPTTITPGTAQSEVQEIATSTDEFLGHPEQAAFEIYVGAEGTPSYLSLGVFATEPIASEFGFTPLTASELQSALETAYGTGGVAVTEPEPFKFRIANQAGSALQGVLHLHVSPFGIGKPKVEVLTEGRSDGEIRVTAENIGDAGIATDNVPVELSDVLPPGLRAVAIVGSRPAASGAFNLRFPTPCSLETLTCTLKPQKVESGNSADGLGPYTRLEMRIQVVAESGATSGELNRAFVSGGEGFLCHSVAPTSGTYYDSGCIRNVPGPQSPSENGFERTPIGPVAPSSIEAPIRISGTPSTFGVEAYELRNEKEGGALTTQAAAHPFQQTTSIVLNHGRDLVPTSGGPEYFPSALAKDLDVNWPPGLIGNTSGIPQCPAADFFRVREGGGSNYCPPQTAVGAVVVSVQDRTLGFIEIPVPLFNLVPRYGEPARFGFMVAIANVPVVIDPSLRSDGDYGITVHVSDITQVSALISSDVTVWGVPGDPRHDHQRGWSCLLEGMGSHPFPQSDGGWGPCQTVSQKNPKPFLFLPSTCGPASQSTVVGDSWPEPFAPDTLPLLSSFTMPALDSCNKVPFAPAIDAEPTSNAATSPTGLNFDIDVQDEGLENAEGLIQSQIKKAVVTLPQGFTTNPSVAEGLHACSEAQFDSEALNSAPGAGCPNESKVGDVEIESPLIEGKKVKGSLFVAAQHQNPYSNLLTLYLVAREPEVGVIVKQALKVTPDPKTGQLTTEVDNIPQLPFSHFRLSFRQGQRSPLITPPACGTYTVTADLYPYSQPGIPFHDESSFQITQGPEGQPCPSGATPPFHPLLEAGTLNNAAGTYSPFYTRLSRKDSEQEITHFSIKLPPGVSGKLAGIPECSDAGVAAAKAREHEGGGTEEENSPSCPKASEVGHSLVGSGVGNVLAYAPGKLYLAGPYHGSNLSLVSITAAKVGPFDLGTVVVRFALKIDPETAEVSVDGATSDPIPHIVDGIPVHLRDIRAYVDRPQFTLNPTSCKKTSTASTVLGSGLNFASEADDVPVTVTSPFQAADCASLGFAPKLALSLKGGTKRGATPAFKAVLTYPKGSYANIASSQVTLPHSEFLEQSHIGTVCTRTQFKEGKIPGEKCPAASVYGRARAVTPILSEPLEGPVYLRSSSHNLPDLVAALHNRQVDIALDGRIDSVQNGRIRNTFEAVPDAPVSKFVLEMQGGKKGLLVNSTDICRTKHKAISHFVGQNGKVYDTNPVLSAKCGGKAKKKGSKQHKRAA